MLFYKSGNLIFYLLLQPPNTVLDLNVSQKYVFLSKKLVSKCFGKKKWQLDILVAVTVVLQNKCFGLMRPFL